MENINVKKFGKVAVLMGGKSAEREVSLNSGKAIFNSLIRKGVDAHIIDVGDGIVQQLENGNFDYAFIALHGRGGEDGRIQGVLDWLNIPYTGSGVTASAIAMNKVQTNRILQQVNLPVLPFEILTAENIPIAESISFPVCIKPANEGSSNGISKVECFEQLMPAFEKAVAFDELVMLEPWVEGREFTVAILENQTLPIVEIRPVKGTFYDYNAKYLSHDTEYICPCDLTLDETKYVHDIALQAFHVIGCNCWGRVDLLQDLQSRFWLTEVNTVPGMTETSLVPKAAKAQGIDFDDLVLKILGFGN